MEQAGGDKNTCIVGIGARTPVGLTAAASAAAVRAAISMIGEHPYFVDKTGEKMGVAKDAEIAIEIGGGNRLLELCVPAIKEALLPLAQSNHGETIPLFLGLPESRPGLPPAVHQEVTHRLNSYSFESSLHVTATAFPTGHSAGLMAMEEAWRQIQNGQIDCCLAGGVDSYMDAETLEWLDDEGQLMSGANRSGFPPGEGAGFCLLTSARFAQRNHLNTLGWIQSAATAKEKNRIKTETICIGEGLSAVFRQVCTGLDLPEEKINTIYCDMNGERYRNEEFVFTALRMQHAFVDVHDLIHPADCWGDVGAASGPLFATLAVSAAQRKYAKGPRTLLWTSSEGGHRSAATLYLPAKTEIF